MLLIYTTRRNARLEYTLGIVMEKILGLKWKWTHDCEEFLLAEGPRLAYCMENPGGGPFLQADGLLFETRITPCNPINSDYRGFPVIFQTTHPDSILPFDPLAASFYLVSRYEEYLPHNKDQYGRFPMRESIAWQGNFLHRPVVHEWAALFLEAMKKIYPSLQGHPECYRYLPTIDIDHAYAYLARPLIRTTAGAARDLIHGRWHELEQRLQVLTGMTTDPYDNYQFIREVHLPYGQQVLWFILFANYGGNDNNIPTRSKSMARLLRDLDSENTVGIHPSLSSGKHPHRLTSEIEGLSTLLKRTITTGRQHFLKISMPDTYRNLLQEGILEDFSMGYASHPGFRAGMATAFPFFDLLQDEITPLVIHPVPLMDVTMMDYLRLTPEKALKKIAETVASVRSVQGEFVSLWHNESLGDSGRWKGWRRVYKEMVRLASTQAG